MIRGEPDSDPLDSRIGTTVLVLADTLSYVVGTLVITTLLAGIVGVATEGGLVGMKVTLFLVGFGLMAYATYRLWPTSPNDRETHRAVERDPTGPTVTPTTETRFQGFVRALPPGRWVRTPPMERQWSPAAKLFVSGIGVLLLSFLMETVLGVA